MRAILILWAIPMFFFWGWYGLSYYDINFGIQFFSREIHDTVFQVYGNILKVPPAEIPAMAAAACAFDTLIIFGLAALRWRKSWYPQTKEWIISRFNRSQTVTTN